MSLEKFNKIKLEVRAMNKDLPNYAIVYIAKVVYSLEIAKNEEKAQVTENLEVLKDYVSKFWNAHQELKRRSNIKKINESLKLKLAYAKLISSNFSLSNIELVCGEWTSFILDFANKEMATNKFGKHLGYAI